jgi:protein phosphatase
MPAIKAVDRFVDEPGVWNEAPAGPRLTAQAAGRTDRGLVREANEDHYIVAELAPVSPGATRAPYNRARSAQSRLFLVADGMGGYAGGSVASRITAHTVEAYLADLLTNSWPAHDVGADDVTDRLQAAVSAADRRVIDEAVRRPELYGMGSTLTLAVHIGRQLFIAHVGDSRAYLERDGRLFRLTRDHTLLTELARRGQLLPGDESSPRLRHTITNAIGGTRAGVRADLIQVPVAAGDVLLLCTDGLTEMLSDAEIAAVLQEHRDPEAACQRLVELANEHGGIDNTTALVATFHAAEE